jgi:folate-binding protein YgfZ
MFVENNMSSSMIDQLIQKFAGSTYSGSEIKFFTNVEEEYKSCKHGVGISLSFNKTIIKLTGKDTLEFLHRVSTNAVKDLNPFYRIPTLFLNEKGRFIDRTTLLNLDNHFLLIGSSNNNRLLNWINKYIINEDIQTSDVSGNYAVIDLVGPQSESFLTLIIGKEIKSLNGNNILNSNVDGFNFFLFANQEINGLKYYRILLLTEQLNGFINYIIDNKSVFDVNFVGSDAFEIFRIESGVPMHPSEINDHFNPHENNLLYEVSFTKGCYIGQEVIARLHTYDKVQFNLVGLVFDEYVNAELPIPIYSDLNEEIGQVTSIAKSFLLEKNIGLGFIRMKKLSSNNKLFIECDSRKIVVSVTGLPFSK